MSLLGAVYGTLLVNTGKSFSPKVSRTLALCDGRPVYRGGDVLSEWAGRALGIALQARSRNGAPRSEEADSSASTGGHSLVKTGGEA